MSEYSLYDCFSIANSLFVVDMQSLSLDEKAINHMQWLPSGYYSFSVCPCMPST